MSQENDRMEEAIRLTEELVQEIKGFRDQAETYSQASSSLSRINQHLENLAETYAQMEIERFEKTVESIKEQLSADRTAIVETLNNKSEALASGLQDLKNDLADAKNHERESRQTVLSKLSELEDSISSLSQRAEGIDNTTKQLSSVVDEFRATESKHFRIIIAGIVIVGLVATALIVLRFI